MLLGEKKRRRARVGHGDMDYDVVVTNDQNEASAKKVKVVDENFFNGRSWQPSLPRTMSNLSWNCHGLGHRRVISGLRDLVWIHKLDLLF